MALEGSLKDFGLADIFQLIYAQKKTGILKMKNATREAKVLFENGLVVTADGSNLEGINKIGEVLLRTRRISEDQLKQALVTQRQSKEKVGVILVEAGAVNKEDLIKALGLQVKEAVFSLFQWKEGHYSFESSDISYERDYWLPINTEFLIMEAVRRIDEWPYIEKKIPNLGLVFEKIKEKEDKIKIAKSEEDSLADMVGESKKEEGIQITQDEMKVFSLIDGQQDVRQLIETTNFGEFETCKALSNLLTAGLILQKSSTEAQNIEMEKIGDIRQIRPSLTVRQIISGVVMIVCLALLGSNSDKSLKTMRQAVQVAGFYHGLNTYNQLKQTDFSILTYFYRYNRLPDSLELLEEAGYPADFIIASKGRAILYKPDNTSGTFNLKARD
jgi:hypothetical protein